MARDKNKYTPEEEAIRDRYYQNMMIGLGYKESRNDYNAQNPTSNAAGKYQFTKVWFNGEPGIKNIQQFAKESNIHNVPNSLEDFKKDSVLQEDYFKYYTKNWLYPQAKSIYEGENPLDLPFEAIGAMVHFQGIGNARTQVKTGQLNKEEKIGVNGAKNDNEDVMKYITELMTVIESNGGKPLDKNELVDAGVDKSVDLKKAKEDFTKRLDAIDNSDLDRPLKEKKRKELYLEYGNNGARSVANEVIDEKNTKLKEEYESKSNLQKVLSNQKLYYDKSKPNLKQLKKIEIEKSTDYDVEKAFEEYPEIFKNNGFQIDSKNLIAIPSNRINTQRSPNSVHHNRYNFEEEKYFKSLRNFTEKNDLQIKYGVETPGGAGGWGSRVSNKGVIQNLTLPNEIQPPTEFEKITDDFVTKPSERIKTETPTETAKTNDATNTTADSGVEGKEKDTQDLPSTTEPQSALEFLDNQLKTTSALSDQQKFNYEKGRPEVPWDSIMGMGMAVIGNDQAKRNKLPLRTEEISEAFKSMTAELKNKSLNGLPVEVEAKIKNDLAEAYQGGLRNIVNASAGNRALVLGNLGGLEGNKVKGLLELNVADYEAKERAFAQYGEALKYMNEFDARRDVANHQIKYGEAFRKKLQGEQLATAGFSKLINDIQYQRENGPGSSNHMYKSFLMQKMFGFDPNLPDDGTGKPGTRSAYESMMAKRGLNTENAQAALDAYQRMSNDEKAKVDEFITKNQNFGDVFDFIKQTGTKPQQQQTPSPMSAPTLSTPEFNPLPSGKTDNALQLIEEPNINQQNQGLTNTALAYQDYMENA